MGLPDEGSLWSSFCLLVHAFASLAAICCCLKFYITGAGVSPDSLINAPLGVVGSAPRTDLARWLRRNWRSSRLPTSLRSHHRMLLYRATAWTQATWAALTLSGTTQYVYVRVQSHASAALAFFMHRLWCCLNVRCASIQRPSQRVAWLLNNTNWFPTCIIAVRFGQRCFSRPHVLVNSAASVFAVLNSSPRLLAHSMLFAAHLSSVMTNCLTWLPVTTKLRSSSKDSPLAETYSSTHLISPEV